MFGKPFNGDEFLGAEIKKFVDEYGIKTIVETGTYKADSTFEFENMVPTVHSIEVNETYYNESRKRGTDMGSKVNFILGSSPEAINKICSSDKLEKPILFFLDAHWYNYNPLYDELEAISRNKLSDSVIVIHDFKVPGKDFGFDHFPDGREYCWENIKEKIEKIYGENFVFCYNQQATGACRGVIFISPKK